MVANADLAEGVDLMQICFEQSLMLHTLVLFWEGKMENIFTKWTGSIMPKKKTGKGKKTTIIQIQGPQGTCFEYPDY